MRIGYGYDSHRFIEGNVVPIGGVKIPFDKGILAHSDGDVLLHAIGDALLGAAALGDLGQHFPDTDPNIKSISSAALLTQIMQMLIKNNYQVVNVDSVIIAEAPKLAKYINEMRANIAKLLEVEITAASVKATTNEKMGWLGRGEGLAAQVVVLISKGS